MQTPVAEQIYVESITVQPNRRPVNVEAVERLAQSLERIGLRTPLTVISVNEGERLDLVAGRHRLEAAKRLGWEQVPCFVIEGDKLDAEMWEIAENLHRAELTALERDEQVARWIELAEARVQSAQVGTNETKRADGRGHRKEGGVRAAARDLGIQKNDAHRATKVASLSDDAKQAAVESGLDDNRSALLTAAKAEPSKQAAVIRDLAEQRQAKANKVERDVKSRAAVEVAEMLAEHVPGEWWDALKANLYAAGASNIAAEFTNIVGQSVMDKGGWQ